MAFLGPASAPMPDRPWRPVVRRGYFWHASWLGARVAVSPDRPLAKWQALVAVVTWRLFRVMVVV